VLAQLIFPSGEGLPESSPAGRGVTLTATVRVVGKIRGTPTAAVTLIRGETILGTASLDNERGFTPRSSFVPRKNALIAVLSRSERRHSAASTCRSGFSLTQCVRGTDPDVRLKPDLRDGRMRTCPT
jgi:hypothetical protein